MWALNRQHSGVYFLHLCCRKLLDPGLSSSSRPNMFLNLLYKSMKADVALRRVKAFVKRLLQISAEQSASFACGALFLVSEVMRAKPGLKILLQEAEGVRNLRGCKTDALDFGQKCSQR